MRYRTGGLRGSSAGDLAEQEMDQVARAQGAGAGEQLAGVVAGGDAVVHGRGANPLEDEFLGLGKLRGVAAHRRELGFERLADVDHQVPGRRRQLQRAEASV